MRKITRLTSIILVLITVLGLCGSCMKSDVMTTVYVGVPWAEDSAEYANVQLAVEDSNLFSEGDYVRIELITVPEDEEGRKEFLKDVNSGKIGMFIYQRDELIDPYLEDRLATLVEIQSVYPACYEHAKSYVMDTATDSDGVNHMLPLMGNYQGVFFNEKIFIENGLTVPKTWDQFLTLINTLKSKNITPFAGGFADGGMKYWLDELILMEGGVAEHSYVPKFGVVNSWARAVNDFKSLYDAGVFNADCMNTTQADAITMFNEGKAAMIVTNSKEIVTESSDVDNMGVFALPLTTTGKKNIGDIICDYDTGVYINTSFLTKRTEIIDTIIKFVIEYLTVDCEEGSSEDDLYYYDYSYTGYSAPWSLPANPYTIGLEPVEIDPSTLPPGEEIPVEDPTEPEEVREIDTLETRVFNMMEDITNAGRSLTTEFKTFDYFIDLVKNYIEKGGDIEALLVDATNKEVAAQNETTVEE